MSDAKSRREQIEGALKAAWDRGDVDALDALLSPDYRMVGTDGGAIQNLQELKASITATRTAFPDLTTTIDEIVIEGDRAAVRWHADGSHDHSFMGVPATHRSVQVHGASFARFENDRIVEEFVTTSDPRSMLTALGIVIVGQAAPPTAAMSKEQTITLSQPDVDLMKQVNRRFVTGVTVVTTMDGNVPKGLAVNAFANISLEPATVMIAIQRTSSTHDVLFRSTHLAINMLSTDQLDVVNRFATKAPDKFAGLDWQPGPYGSPLLSRSSARMEVEIRERLQASTHTVFICRVVGASVSEHQPMVYSAGSFYDGGALEPLR